jgi:cytochrome c oxidase cbb3-type subunit 3
VQRRVCVMVATLVLCLALSIRAQQPPAGGRGPAFAKASARQGAPPGPPVDAVAAERGRLFFAQTCSFCHGIDARGGAEGGSDLTQSPIVLGDPTGAQLGQFLQVGRPDKKMPPFPLSPAQLSDVAMFLRSAVAAGGRGVAAVVVGNARAGEAFFIGAGNCTKCHSVTGDLKGIGLKYPTATLQGRLVLPRGRGGYPGRGSEIPPFRSVTVTLPSGERYTGTLVSVSLFAVTLHDASGVRLSFTRDEDVPMVEITDPLQAHLDLMRTMTDKTMHDLTAYLVTLR